MLGYFGAFEIEGLADFADGAELLGAQERDR
jgi:hypothetical protein